MEKDKAIESKVGAVDIMVNEFGGSPIFGVIAKLIIDNKDHTKITSWEASPRRAAISATIILPGSAPILIEFEQKPEKK